MHTQLRKHLLIAIFLFLPILLACQLFSGAAMLSGGQQMGGNQATLLSVALSSSPSAVGGVVSTQTGGTVNFNAVANYSDGSQKDVTAFPGAVLASSNTSAATIGAQPATPCSPCQWPVSAIAAGNSNISLTYSGQTSNTITVQINTVVVVDTSPFPPATVGTAYSHSVSASGGTGPYTYAWTGCPASAGFTATCASNGTLSGTPTATTGSPFTICVQATDNASHSSPACPYTPSTFTLTVNASGQCGPGASPRAYQCSPNRTDTAPAIQGATNCVSGCLPVPNVVTGTTTGGTTGTNTLVFPSANGTSWASSDYYAPTSLTGNGITRLTDANTFQGRSCDPTISGGSNEYNIDPSGLFMRIGCGGAYPIMPLGVNGSGYVINGAAGGGNLQANSVSFGSHGMASRLTNGRFWSSEANGANNVALFPNNCSITSGSANLGTAVVACPKGAAVFNWLDAPGIPNPFPLGSGGLPVSMTESTPSTADMDISWGIGDGAGGQGNANWLIVYCLNGPCPNGGTTGQLTTLNILTGNYWTWCTPGTGAGQCGTKQNNTNPTGTITTLCPANNTPVRGMHNSNIFMNGQILHWAAPCQPNGTTQANGTMHFWNIGTNNAVGGTSPLGHNGNGYTAADACSWYGFGSIDAAAMLAAPTNPLTLTTIYSFQQSFPGGVYDLHGTFVPQATSGNLQPFFCSSNYLPGTIPFAGEIFILSNNGTSWAPSRFGPNFTDESANSIFNGIQAIATAPFVLSGNVANGAIFFGSNWQRALGTDTAGQVRTDVFAYSKLQ